MKIGSKEDMIFQYILISNIIWVTFNTLFQHKVSTHQLFDTDTRKVILITQGCLGMDFFLWWALSVVSIN